ncbi:hypothetical protein pVco14_024 [Vibrio phage pVco-14]|nr:hypothetical protein pVco14_024 [Vibrio phage pVco-14]
MAASDAFYNGIIAKIAPVFEKLGTSFAVRAPAQFNEETLSKTPGQTRSVAGIVADQQTTLELTGQAWRGMDGGEWVATKSLILPANAKPLPSEEIQVDGKWFSLSKVVAVKPADVTVIYLLDVSK